MSSINPNRSSLIIARLESSFELSSLPLGQISIYYEIHPWNTIVCSLETYMYIGNNVDWKKCSLEKLKSVWKTKCGSETLTWCWKHNPSIRNIFMFPISNECFETTDSVSNRISLFPNYTFCLSWVFLIYLFCFQSTLYVSKVHTLCCIKYASKGLIRCENEYIILETVWNIFYGS